VDDVKCGIVTASATLAVLPGLGNTTPRGSELLGEYMVTALQTGGSGR
jgi:hypothetical protein